MKIGIIDYGAGNIRSVINSLDRVKTSINFSYFVSNKYDELSKSDKIIFPGVGHAKFAMENLVALNLDEFIKNYKKKVLGICLGMQLFCKKTEEGDINCLGIFDETVKKFDQKKVLKVPHMGWNIVQNTKNFSENYFYFVHSYFIPKCQYTVGITSYNDFLFSSAIEKENFIGMQFHPEKSGLDGERIILDFLSK